VIESGCMRKPTLTNGEYYHVYNRGVEKRSIFQDEDDFARFLQSLIEFNTLEPIGSLYENSFQKKLQLGRSASKLSDRLVDIVCYCLNSNHYHCILRQLVDGGISTFMHRVGGGFTKHFNIKYKRTGVLFEGKFKAVHIESNTQLLHTSAYVNLNNKVHRLGRSASKVSKSSWDEYVGRGAEEMCEKNIILRQFKGKAEYKSFATDSLKDILDNKVRRRELQNLLIE
jgi:putative transposase